MKYPPTYNKKKEILYGTQENVNPWRTATRRLAKLGKKFGGPLGLYLWIVERIHRDKNTGIECTKFRIADAAKEFKVNETTIDNWLKKLRDEGWISRHHRKYMGRNSYCTYFVNPINELIEDDGKLGQKESKRGGKAAPTREGKAAPAKRSLSVPAAVPSVAPAQQHPLDEAARAEAGRGVASPQTPPPPRLHPSLQQGQGDISSQLDKQIATFLLDNEKTILSYGFKHRSVTSLVQDVQIVIKEDQKTWDLFIKNWPFLMKKLEHNQFLKKATKDIAFGWLFRRSLRHPDETNLQVILFSHLYDDVDEDDVAAEVYQIGQIVMYPINSEWREVIVREAYKDYGYWVSYVGQDHQFAVRASELKQKGG